MINKRAKIYLIICISCLIFSGCGFKVVDDVEYQRFITEGEYTKGRKTKIRVLLYFANYAGEIVSGGRTSSADELALMKSFQKDLATVNDSLPEGQKILRPDGRLVQISMSTPYPGISPEQEQTMVDIVSGNAKDRTPEVREAIIRLGLMMSDIRDNFDLAKPPRQF